MKNSSTPAAPYASVPDVETLLVGLRNALAGTELWNALTLNHNENLGPGTTARNLVVLADRPGEPWNCFLHKFWARTESRSDDVADFFVARHAVPGLISLRTMERMALVEGLPLLANALDGLQVELLDEGHSWYWDHDERQPDGSATHRTVYEYSLVLNALKPFKARAWLRGAYKRLCTSPDLRADRCPFQLEREVLGRPLCHSYEMTTKGLVLEYETLARARRAAEKVYTGCVHMFNTPKKHEGAVLRVEFPSVLSEAAEAAIA